MEKQQTAIDWLVENLYYILKTEHYDIIEKAKEMEKKQIINAYKEFLNTTLSDEVYEDYYNETFKNN
jgi:dsDNA-specific endonuclease/ATPase MutS2